ncbi:U32 family peptidase [Phreatobacter sp. HK31-P]
MELTVGPLLFHWATDAWSDFYARLADEAPVDRVVIGESVCSKRLPLYADRILEAVERLERGGKSVVLTSLALVTLPRERRAAAGLFAQTDHEVEIDDLTLMRWAGKDGEADKPAFSIGPLVNVYNESTLGFFAGRGARAVCLPPELPFASVASLAAAARPLGIGVEVFAFGRVPLAISARCYHARVHGRTKDSCQFVCDQDPDGMVVKTLDGQDFLAVNGVQTLSYNCCNLIGDVGTLRDAGVTALRLSPHSGDFVAVCRAFRDAIDGRDGETLDLSTIAVPPMPFSRGFMFGATGAS